MVRVLLYGVALTALFMTGAAAQEKKDEPANASQAQAAGQKNDGSKPAGHLKPIEIKLPKPAFKGTPKNIPPGTNLEKPRDKPREPFLAPPGTTNVAAGKPVSASDTDPIVGELKFVTDGDKEPSEGSYVELGPGLQWVQVDLKGEFTLYAVLVWHFHASARVYHDVVVQVADDADFTKNVRTVYTNDHDNSSGLGLGQEKEYWETYEGRLMDCKGEKARYVRLYSKGSTADDQNHYVEVEAYGLPAR
jgi:hypothetical protein